MLYVLGVLTGIFAQGFVSERLVVWGDAAATATSILTHRSLYELGFTMYMIEMASQIAMTALFYRLLKPVNKSVALVGLCLGLAGCTIKTFSRVFYLAPLFVLGGAHYLSVFNPEQLQALALLFLKVNDRGAGIALAFFGFETVLHGYLIFRSTFLPRILGVLAAIAGLGWLTFLSPTLGYRVFLYIAAYGLLVVVAMIVWLLVFGVDEQRWKEQAPRIRAIAIAARREGQRKNRPQHHRAKGRRRSGSWPQTAFWEIARVKSASCQLDEKRPFRSLA